MAERLIEDMTGPWHPSDYVDDYSRSLMALIERKVKSGDVHEAAEEPSEPKRPRESVDLMQLLKKSLDGRGPPAARSRTAVRTGSVARRRPAARRPRRSRRT